MLYCIHMIHCRCNTTFSFMYYMTFVWFMIAAISSICMQYDPRYIYMYIYMYVCIYRYNYVLFYVVISPVLSGFIMWCIYLYCPSADEVILTNMGKIDSYQTTTKHNRTSIICLILGVCILSNLWYKLHQIPQFKCFSSHLSVVFAQSIEARY